MAGKGGKNGKVTIIKREEVVGGGHHGGAWKVAYADFVTAMMAFFLLMWLLNATTEDQRKGLADYFSPSNLMSHGSSGSGAPFGGKTPFDDGALVSDRGAVSVTMGKRPQVENDDDGEPEIATQTTLQRTGNADAPSAQKFAQTGQATAQPDQFPGVAPQNDKSNTLSFSAADQAALRDAEKQIQGKGHQAQKGEQQNGDLQRGEGPKGTDGTKGNEAFRPTEAQMREQREKAERAAFDKAAQEIREAVRNDPAMKEMLKQLSIDMTPEGLRIQLLDEDRQPMFTTGSSAPNDRAKQLLQKITPVLMRLPEAISIAGHTDSTLYPTPGRTNWELSTERANVTRRMLVEAGLPDSRIRTITGHADRDPLLPNDPLAAANRRISIVVLREAAAPVSRPKPVPPAPQPKQ